MAVNYYPLDDDNLWNEEVAKLLPYTDGNGLDIGCGGRSIKPEIKRLDIDPEKRPDILASGDDIPVDDAWFDFVVAQHVLEHFADQDKALKEWLRIIKPGGYILIIHPDVTYTGKQLPPEANPDLKLHPYNKHYYERNYSEFLTWLNDRTSYGFTLVDAGTACIGWSFYAILRKTA